MILVLSEYIVFGNVAMTVKFENTSQLNQSKPPNLTEFRRTTSSAIGLQQELLCLSAVSHYLRGNVVDIIAH